jgi:N-acetyl-gamma-glutamyl-phosphate reductase/acetylglutamate kinase
MYTKVGSLNNVTDNVWDMIKKTYSRLIWAVDVDDANKSWHFEHSNGSITLGGKIVFWYGLSDLNELSKLVTEFSASQFVEPSPSAATIVKSQSATHDTSSLGGSMGRSSASVSVRAYSTMSTTSSPSLFRSSTRIPSIVPGARGLFSPSSILRHYATEAHRPANVALIGARGYTGQNLITLLNSHPFLSLSHVSSRELEGQKLAGYTKQEIVYSNLKAEQITKMQKNGEVDCWVMALPNGVCAPFVRAVDEGSDPKKGLVVDLSADYRFTDEWTYGLPGGLWL